MYGEEERRTDEQRGTSVNFPPLFLTERTDNGTVGGLPEAKVWHVLIAHVHARAEWVMQQERMHPLRLLNNDPITAGGRRQLIRRLI